MCLFRPLFFFFFVFFLYTSQPPPLWRLLIQLGPPRLQTVLGVRGLQELGWVNALGMGVGWGCERDSGVEDEFSRLSTKTL